MESIVDSLKRPGVNLLPPGISRSSDFLDSFVAAEKCFMLESLFTQNAKYMRTYTAFVAFQNHETKSPQKKINIGTVKFDTLNTCAFTQ